jgi:hypothetical protein
MMVVRKEALSAILVLSMFIITIAFVPDVVLLSLFNANQAESERISPNMTDSTPPIQDEHSVPKDSDHSILSYDSPVNGILDPVVVEQSGYAASENISARTDTKENLAYDLPLDVAHNWVADKAEVNVWNLEKHYAVNGSFNDGSSGTNVFPNGSVLYHPSGWDANSTDTTTYSDDVQLAGYDSSGSKYVTVESQGGKVGQNAFGHAAGTRIVWTQIVQNAPYSENFILSFDFFYLRGPIDGPTGLDPIAGNCSVALFINGVNVWNMSLLLLTQRGIWLSTGNIPITLFSAPSTFLLEIGLIVDQTLILDKRNDYDGDPSHLPDGIDNSAYITVFIDDLSFIKQTPPTAEQVALQLSSGGVMSSLSGSMGTYYVSITNASYWISSPVPVALTANTSVSFDYKTRLYSHRFTDSNWRTDISSLGVSYIVNHGLSSFLTFYAYVGYLGNYEDPNMVITFPTDWENLTLSDPFLTDLTGFCTIDSGYLSVPTSIINRLGWWEIKLESPNYAKSIKPQILDVTWSDENVFRIGNTTRADITIGTATQVLGSLANVNITWFKPSDVVWTSELISGGSLGQIFSTQQTFAIGSSPAGEWWVEVSWSNGTEVAYDRSKLEVHHTAGLIADPVIISTDTGLTVTGIVRYTDGDTGANLLEPSAIVVANWSIIPVFFVPNTIHNWWEGTFDTSLVDAGEFIIAVNASRPYFDNASCQIVIQSVRVTRLNSPNAPWTADVWGHMTTLTFKYEYYDYGTTDWNPIENNTNDVSMLINWTAGYWSVEEDVTPGIYLVHLDTSAKSTGTWLINTTFSKPNHQPKALLLTMIISPMTSSLSIAGEISARVDLDAMHNITLTFRDGEGSPVTNANVTVDSISPSTGLSYTTISEISGQGGNYSTSLSPHVAGVFTIRFIATGMNVEPAMTVFVLVVNDVNTKLDIFGSTSVEIGLADVYNTTFRFAMSNLTGISNAQINITYSGGTAGGLSYNLAEIGLGNYSIEFNSTISGTYLITIAAFKQYYQSGSSAFFLVVREISTHLTSLNGTSEVVGFGKNYRLFVNFTTNSGIGLSGADVSIANVVPATGLVWDNASMESDGLYSILLTPLESNTFTVLVQASLFNHQTQFVLFTLTATAIATSLIVLNASTTISLDQTFTTYLLFQDEDFAGLEGANLTIQNSPVGLSISNFDVLGNGYYRVTISPAQVGTFDIVFKASKSGYQNGYASFTLGAVRIPTDLHIGSGLSSDSVMFSVPYDLFVLYDRSDTGVNVTGATIDFQASPDTSISWSYIEVNEGYLISIETTRVGRWTLTITAQKTGHASGSVEFILDVKPIPIQVELLSPRSIEEGQSYALSVRLTQQNTSIPVTNATLTFRISPSRSGDFSEMLETSPGVYTAQYPFPLYSDTTEYLLEVKIDKDNFEYSQIVFESSIIKTINLGARMAPLVMGGSGVAAAFFILLVGVRISSKRKKRQLDHDLAVKQRFDDADNIIGVIILHKKSGLPLYSKMMKGGFEEGIVAAFIAAVTHFREEFEMFDEERMMVIPISDIIRAAQTKNLICAVITVRSASIEHNRKMEEFARQVATYLDDLVSERPNGIIDSKVVDMLEYIFNTTMDGFLLQYYKVATAEKFPKRYELLDETLHDTDTRHCTKPVLLAKSLTVYGISEARGCALVLEAIEKELIVRCEGDETETPEIDFADFFSKPDKADSAET